MKNELRMAEGNIRIDNISFSEITKARKLFAELQGICGSGCDTVAIAALYKMGVDQGKRIERARRAAGA